MQIKEYISELFFLGTNSEVLDTMVLSPDVTKDSITIMELEDKYKDKGFNHNNCVLTVTTKYLDNEGKLQEQVVEYNQLSTLKDAYAVHTYIVDGDLGLIDQRLLYTLLERYKGVEGVTLVRVFEMFASLISICKSDTGSIEDLLKEVQPLKQSDREYIEQFAHEVIPYHYVYEKESKVWYRYDKGKLKG